MDKGLDSKDLKSFECSSLCELDRKFYGEQNSSGMSVEQLSTSRASTGTFADGADSKPSFQVSHLLLSDTGSPLQGFSLNIPNPPDADGYQLAVPLQGKSSTPQVLSLQKLKLMAGLDLSNTDLSVSQMTWDVSLIKSESPRLDMESDSPARFSMTDPENS